MAYIQDWGMRVQAQPQINTTRRSFLHLSQNENGRMLNIRITDVNIPTGSTAVLAGTKPDGTVYSQAGTLAGNTATFAEDVQMTAVAGTWDAKITVTNGGNCICTARITITIDPDTVAGGAIPSDSQLDGIIAECRAIADSVRKEAYGSPLVADAVEDMTDQSRVYVYTGSESGMTAGHWYYYNGSAWADGGVYNSIAVDTDTTLSIAGKAADAKKVGDELADVKEDLNAVFVTDSASGSVAHFVDGADDVPMKSVKVNIAPVQSGSGDPSPSNVRPITGYDSVKVTMCGRNFVKNKAKSHTANGVTFTRNEDGTFSLSGTSTATSSTMIYFAIEESTYPSNQFAVMKKTIPNGTYRIMPPGSQYVDMQLFGYNSNSDYGVLQNAITEVATVVVDDTYKYNSVRIVLKPSNGVSFDGVTIKPCILLASDSDDTYEPYNGNTYNISLSSAGTVYGGKLDVLTGKLTVYPYYASYNGETLTGRWISDRDVYVAGTTPTIGAQVVDMSGTGTEVQLEANEIASLLGANNLWADTGDVAVEYRADTKLYIDKRLGV